MNEMFEPRVGLGQAYEFVTDSSIADQGPTELTAEMRLRLRKKDLVTKSRELFGGRVPKWVEEMIEIGSTDAAEVADGWCRPTTEIQWGTIAMRALEGDELAAAQLRKHAEPLSKWEQLRNGIIGLGYGMEPPQPKTGNPVQASPDDPGISSIYY